VSINPTQNPKLSFLKTVQERGALGAKIEEVLASGFPPSAVYPAYWYSTSPGSRLAFQLGCRVVFSRKEMTIVLEPLSAEEKSLQEVRFDRAKQRARDRTSALLEFVRQVDLDISMEDSNVAAPDDTGPRESVEDA
jgi:hypothetical protein